MGTDGGGGGGAKITILVLISTLCIQGTQSDEDGYDIEDDGKPSVMGTLPESVFREIAWYGIYQIQPLLLSSKNRMIAHLAWMHALGRPHVLLETAPQDILKHHRINRQLLAEEASKWSKDQKNNHDNVMETIRTGGNGITIRTVVGPSLKPHTILVHKGNYFMCVGSEPDISLYREKPASVHTLMCWDGKPALPLEPNIDPCIEAEHTQLEYSFNEGWSFCFGSGDRPENSHLPTGELTCGNKTKVAFKNFLAECAIDNNVVISYTYFGDDPHKEPTDNGTLCPSWTPCTLSYLYRLELPEAILPHLPSTTPNPCDTTMCPECLGVTPDPKSIEFNAPVPDDYLPPWMDKNLLAEKGIFPTEAPTTINPKTTNDKTNAMDANDSTKAVNNEGNEASSDKDT